jgi:peptide deformylase
MLEIITAHYKISKPVKKYSEIHDQAEKMIKFIWKGGFKGFYNKAFAIAHCQVSETPYAFFVVAGELIKEKWFKRQVIINPEILEAPDMIEGKTPDGKVIRMPNASEYDEPCMSFPFRKPKKVLRYNKIKIRYQIPTLFGRMKTIEEWCMGIKSEIFQHEYDHTKGENIYFSAETPVKWWELIGNPKSKGGVSLDSEPEDMQRAREISKGEDLRK